MLDESIAKKKIVTYAKSIFDRGLTSGASANMSVRIAEGWVITPTNTCFGFLEEDELSVVDHQGNLLRGAKPSKEFLLHQAMYAARPGDTCIIHLHSTYATALSCLAMDGAIEHAANAVPTYTPYLTMRLGVIALVPYFSPGDKELASAVGKVAENHAGVLMANHGPIVSAKTAEDAFYGMEELEESCKLAMLLQGASANRLTDLQIQTLRAKFSK